MRLCLWKVYALADLSSRSGNQQQRRDAIELEALLARADTDESGALSLGSIASIASFAAPVISGIIDHFKNK